MTSTSFNVGLGDGSRSSSRVLRPPGGGHTDIFGGEPEPPRGRRAAPALVDHIQQQGQGDEPTRPTNGAATPSQNGRASAPSPAEAEPSPVEAKPPPAEPREARPADGPAPKAITPTEPKGDGPKRVRVPPGGFSSGLW